MERIRRRVLATVVGAVAIAGVLLAPVGSAAATPAVPGRPPAVHDRDTAGVDVAERDVVAGVTRSVGLVVTGRGYGSGWIVDDGVVVTNEHVVRGEREAMVEWASGGWSECWVAAGDRHEDLALLGCPTDDRPALPIREELAVVGEPVSVVGYPRGDGPTVTSGIITDDAFDWRGRAYVEFTAAIAPGSSGSPVVDRRGQVVGVVARSGGIGPRAGDVTALVDAVGGLPSSPEAAAARMRWRRSLMFGGSGAVVALLLALRERGSAFLWWPLWGIAVGVAIALGFTQLQLVIDGPTEFTSRGFGPARAPPVG